MFIKYRIYLSQGQLDKIRAAAKKKEAVSIIVDPQLPGNFDLYLTQSQINKLSKGKPSRLNLSMTQLQKNGGFIFSVPLILGAISAASALTGAASGIAKVVQEKNHQKALEEESKRHNVAVENLLKAKDQIKGSGAYLPKRYNRSGVSTGYGTKKK